MRRGLHRYGVVPERSDWYRVDGVGWVYGTSSDVRRGLQEYPIDDGAARSWMQKGARLNLPRPSLQIRRPPE